MNKHSHFPTKSTLIVIILILSIAGLPIIQSLQPLPTTYQNDGTLSGYVTDTSAQPIQGARICVHFHGTYREDYTSATGYYHVTDIPICYCYKNCTASHEWYHPEWILMPIYENSTHDFILIPKNSSGINPPTGPTEGLINDTLTFYFDIPQDPQHDSILLQWYWDDGSFTDWLGPYSAGEIASASHTWTTPGDYYILVKLKDIHGSINTSDTLQIHILEGPQIIILPGLIQGGRNKVTATIENIGDIDAQNIQWSITITGGILGKINSISNGTITLLNPGNEAIITINTKILGFGSIDIIVYAKANNTDPISQQIFGLVFFIYIYTPPIL